MTPETKLDISVQKAVEELNEVISSFAGELREELGKFGLERLTPLGEVNLAYAFVQTFIEFAKRCDAPYARLVMLPPLRMRQQAFARAEET